MGTEGGDKCVDNVDKLGKNGVGVKRDGSESGLQHQEAATRAGQL